MATDYGRDVQKYGVKVNGNICGFGNIVVNAIITTIKKMSEMVLCPTTLKKMDWKVFEELTAKILRMAGYQAELIKPGPGPDGGIDVVACPLTNPGDKIAVQCKRYSRPIEVKQVREFVGAFLTQGYSKGIFITTSTFNDRAINELSSEKRLEMIDGNQILEGIADLGSDCDNRLKRFIFKERPDWNIQTCPICGEKMAIREPKGDQDWKPFWGCQNYAKKGAGGKSKFRSSKL